MSNVLPIYVRTLSHYPAYKLVDCILVLRWDDIEGKTHEEKFMTRETCNKIDPFLCEMSWIHIWDNPKEGLMKFLSHCPIHNISVKIEVV